MNSCYERIKRALGLFEEAKNSRSKVYVTELTRRIASPKSHKMKEFRHQHYLWGDVWHILQYDEYFTPFPLAAKILGVWVYGYADLVYFKNCTPIAVYEVKQYGKFSKYDKVQVKIYAYLTYIVFNVKPKAYLIQQRNNRFILNNMVEVKWNTEEVEDIIHEGLRRIFGFM
ncbi:MAG: hypothetical protein DRJ32_01875 [Thermoprotei archaeon]|nr:MAG: hypothetical protein DRJ32_01875 [Thermoprotei archaeon]